MNNKQTTHITTFSYLKKINWSINNNNNNNNKSFCPKLGVNYFFSKKSQIKKCLVTFANKLYS